MSVAPSKLPLRTKIAFGSGSLAFGIKDQGFGTLLMLYYNQVIGLSAAWVGLAILVATIIDAVTDPMIGQWSDHYRSRLGRRHSFMYASALPVAIAYLLLWAPPDAAPPAQFAWLLVTSIVVRVAISAFEVPSSALMAELTADYDERTSLSLWRSIFLALGLVGGGVLAFKVFLTPTPEQPIGQLNAAGYAQYSVFACVVMLFAILVATRGTQDRIPLLNPPKPREVGENLISNMKVLLSNRAYVSVVACIFFFAIGGGLTSTLGAYIATYFWKLSADQLGSLAGGAGIGAILGLAISGVAGRFGKRNLAIGAFAVALVASISLVSLKLAGVIDLDADGMMPLLVAQTMTVSATVAIGLVMGGSMLADVADHVEARSGRRMEGLMFAALIMTQKAVSGMGVFVSGMVLTAIAFPEKANPATVPPETLTHLGLFYVLSLGIMVTLALVSIAFYPITRKSHDSTVAELRRARVQPTCAGAESVMGDGIGKSTPTTPRTTPI
jgi:glycoside/pentoside/hexuronide:cation symporter, GPH family